VTDAVLAYDAELEEKARAAIAALEDIAPRNTREALIARRMLALDAMSVESLQLAGREPRSTSVRIAPHGSRPTAHWVRRGDGKPPKAAHEPFCAAIARWAMVTQ
jgi:hypothetical protein